MSALVQYEVINDRGVVACTFNDPTPAEIFADCECARRGALTVREVITTVEVRELHRADPDEARAA